MRAPSIKEVVVGMQKRYRWVIDVGVHADTGKRRQLTRTFDDRGEAEQQLEHTRAAVAKGEFVPRSRLTLGQYLTEWERATSAAPATRYALLPVHERLGGVPLQQVAVSDVVELVNWLRTCGRRRGGQPGTPLSQRTVQLTLTKLRAALQDAVLRRLVDRNMASLVALPSEEDPRIYFVERHGFVKIGHSGQYLTRIAQIAAGSCMPQGMTIGPVRLLATMRGSLAEEKELHGRFEHLRLEGEWFLLDDELWDFIVQLEGYTGESREGSALKVGAA